MYMLMQRQKGCTLLMKLLSLHPLSCERKKLFFCLVGEKYEKKLLVFQIPQDHSQNIDLLSDAFATCSPSIELWNSFASTSSPFASLWAQQNTSNLK